MDRNQVNPTMMQNITMEDLATAKTETCECGCVVFDQGVIIKKTSPLSKIGEKAIQIPVMYCVKCGTVVKESCPVSL